MKKILFILLNFCISVSASHLKGGEITWECNPNGNGTYIFYLKLYRDCNGINVGNVQQLSSTAPGLATIPMIQVINNDLTPLGCGNTCNNPNGFAGATEEFIYKSNPLTLNGTPPSTGWVFYWNFECCRNNTDNIINTGTMALRTIMYPYPSIVNTNPCYDNSPRFIIAPVSFLCIGDDFTGNSLGVDEDYDSLGFGFDYPWDNLNSNLSFSPNYSVNNPMPGNPTVDSITGELNIFPQLPSALQGNYTLVTRIDSYRCGVKIASVFREIQVAISANCDSVCGVTGSTNNHPPDISPAPFINPVSGLLTDFSDTVTIGDTVQFTLSVTEFEYQKPNCWPPQEFWIDAHGLQMDSGSISPFVHCNRPPCAHLDFSTPAGPFLQGKALNFEWIIHCAHAINSCNNEYTSYPFVIKAKDDHCPHPGFNYQSFSIVVKGLKIIQNGDTLTVNTFYTNLQWYVNGSAIPGATNDTLITNNVGGDYSVQAVTGSGCILTSSEINMPLGVSEVSLLSWLHTYPNPVSSVLNVEINSTVNEEAQINVIDSYGSIIKYDIIKLNQGNNFFSVNTDFLSNGIYYLLVKGKDETFSKPIVVMQ